jgi:hypothetical protein
MSSNSQTTETSKGEAAARTTGERIGQILAGVKIPTNRFCMTGDSFDTLQSADQLMTLLAAIDNAQVNGCEFEMPDVGPCVMFILREMVQDAVRYAAEVNDLQLTLRTHAEIGGLEKFIQTFKLDKPAPADSWRPGRIAG